MNATSQIIAKLQEIFAPMDAEVLESSQAWAMGRVAALQAFKASDEYAAIKYDAWKVCPKLFAIAGGKTWYSVFNGRNRAMIEEFMVKNCAAIAAKRNVSIAKKLDKAGVSEVVSEEFAETRDGFNGFFIVNTDKGQKRVRVETIRAGGYNIQCLHLRVLVSVK